MGKLLRLPRRTKVSPGDQFWNWLRYGIDRGWVSEPACDTHDGTPMTPEEELEWEDGLDPCVHVVRLWKQV